MQILKNLMSFLLQVNKFKRRMSTIDLKVDRMRRLTEESDARIATHLKNLEGLKSKLDSEYEKYRVELVNAAKLNKALEESLEATQEQLRTANEITIPTLVEAHKIVLSRWQAENAILAMRTVAATPDRDLS